MGLAGVERENGTFSVSCGLSGCESYPLTGIVSGGRTLSPADESGVALQCWLERERLHRMLHLSEK